MNKLGSNAARSILLVTNIFPPYIGGPATFIDRLAHKLVERGHSVTVVCTSELPSEPTDENRPFKVIRACIRIREWYEIIVRIRLFVQFLLHRKILVNGLEAYVAEVASVLPRRYVLKIVGDSAWEVARNRGTTSSDIDQFQVNADDQRKHAGIIRKRQRSLRGARTIVTPSMYLQNVVKGWGVAHEHIRVIPNGVGIGSSVRESSVRSANDLLEILFVGRLTNWKGVETLLFALQGLDGVRASVVGDGPELPHLMSIARQLQLTDRVVFRGRQPASEVEIAMRQAHVLVLVSLYEGMSHTLLEALALGLPAIASRAGGNEEVIVDGDNGLLIPPEDHRALREALVLLRDNESKRRTLAQQARLSADKFSLDRTLDSYLALLDA